MYVYNYVVSKQQNVKPAERAQQPPERAPLTWGMMKGKEEGKMRRVERRFYPEGATGELVGLGQVEMKSGRETFPGCLKCIGPRDRGMRIL